MEGAAGARSKVWLALAAFVVLAGSISLMASMHQRHSSSCGSGKLFRPKFGREARDTLPRQIFSLSSNRILRDGHSGEPNVLNGDDGIVGTVSRSSLPSLAKSVEVTIPRTIWQTARSRRETPQAGIDLYNSWTKQNPTWDHYFMDDEDVDAFVATHYNETVLQAFRDLPLGVMRADVFRYMILYQYGGVYADMDTDAYQPVRRWAPHGCQFAVATENGFHFCQWAFASVPGHGALGRVLELVLQRIIARVYKEYLARGDEEFVHEVTGPSVFTEGIMDFLGVPHKSHDDVELIPMVEERREEFKESGVCLMTIFEMQMMLSNRYSSLSQDLQTGSWNSWTKERAELMKGIAEQQGEDSQDGEGQDADEHMEDEPADEHQVEQGQEEKQEEDEPADEHQGEEGQEEKQEEEDEPADEHQGEEGQEEKQEEDEPADEHQVEEGQEEKQEEDEPADEHQVEEGQEEKQEEDEPADEHQVEEGQEEEQEEEDEPADEHQGAEGQEEKQEEEDEPADEHQGAEGQEEKQEEDEPADEHQVEEGQEEKQEEDEPADEHQGEEGQEEKQEKDEPADEHQGEERHSA